MEKRDDRPSSGPDILLASGRPDLYRKNPFRVACLPVDATPREISKQIHAMEMEAKFSGKLPMGNLPLDPPPDLDTIRESIHRLRDSEERLVAELFWIWPNPSDKGTADEAMVAFSRGDIHKAKQIWTARERTDGVKGIPSHNLAVLAHASALDLEAQSLFFPLSRTQIHQREAYWNDALAKWKAVLECEGFWSRVSTRIRELDDPRLKSGAARRIRTSLPSALVSITVRLAVAAAEKGNDPEIRRHHSILKKWDDALSGRQSGGNSSIYRSPIIVDALRQGVDPLRQRIKALTRAAEKDKEVNARNGHSIASNLIEHSRPVLSVMDSILPEDFSSGEAAHDEVALSLHSCIISFGVETKDWKTCGELLEIALAVAAGEAAKSKIKEDLRTVKENHEFGKVHDTCWFCGKQPKEESHSIEVRMHGNIQRTPTIGGTNITWRHIRIVVPRCGKCRAAHAKASEWAAIGGIGGAVAGGLTGCGAIGHGGAGILLMILFGAVGFLIGKSIDENNLSAIKNAHADFKPFSHRNEFPQIKQLLSEGWQFGERPNNN
ncbi:MAG: hypothetical protein HY896_10000 [Deltaproteobacteria bacterium]|nr:hypothetical protein [Deltaproteobacteria bacterium]